MGLSTPCPQRLLDRRGPAPWTRRGQPRQRCCHDPMPAPPRTAPSMTWPQVGFSASPPGRIAMSLDTSPRGAAQASSGTSPHSDVRPPLPCDVGGIVRQQNIALFIRSGLAGGGQCCRATGRASGHVATADPPRARTAAGALRGRGPRGGGCGDVAAVEGLASDRTGGSGRGAGPTAVTRRSASIIANLAN